MASKDYPPVRTIGISSRSMTGVVPGVGQYESSLERDFMELIRFDPNVASYSPQPLTLEYLNADGVLSRYTPDGLIEYRRDVMPAKSMRNVLCEVKYRADFKANWRPFMARFRAAKRYAEEHGWDFRVFTEREIRTPYLDNVRFLTGYRVIPEDAEEIARILGKLTDLRDTTPEALLSSLYPDRWRRAEVLPGFWYLVANSKIGCDLSEPLTMHSHIWIEGDSE